MKEDSADQFVSTIVSILPFPINETKPGLITANFKIPKAAKDDFEILHVAPTEYPLYIDIERGSVRIPVPSDRLSQSIIDDFINAQLAVRKDVEEPCHPGLFFVLGKRDKEYIIREHGDALSEARAAQRNWFKFLVQLADDDWQKFRQHKTISDLQRFAARDLGIERPWLLIIHDQPKAVGIKTCPACQMGISEKAIICSFCRCILDPKEYDKFTFATTGAPNVASVSK